MMNLKGLGHMLWKIVVYYVGEWKFGFRHGKGVLHYADGKIKYKGDWVNGKFDGYGTFYLDNGDGQHYKGQFKNNEMYGKGAFYSSDGKFLYESNTSNSFLFNIVLIIYQFFIRLNLKKYLVSIILTILIIFLFMKSLNLFNKADV